MAQIVKLKRTTIEGKVPSTSNLSVGELAINVYDGKVFLRKSGSVSGIDEVIELVGVNTSTPITGSINITGDVTASYFVGDGSQLTGLTVDQATTSKLSFTNSSTWTVQHNLSTLTPLVQVYDNNNSQIIPGGVTIVDANNVRITFPQAESGYAIVAKGGHIVSGSIPAANILDFNDGVTEIINTAGVLSGSEQITLAGDVTGTADATVIANIDGGDI